MLKAHDIAQLVDVRTIPKSRRVPQFNSESLAATLPKLGIEYVTPENSGRPASREEGFHQYRLAQRLVPRLCRLHGL